MSIQICFEYFRNDRFVLSVSGGGGNWTLVRKSDRTEHYARSWLLVLVLPAPISQLRKNESAESHLPKHKPIPWDQPVLSTLWTNPQARSEKNGHLTKRKRRCQSYWHLTLFRFFIVAFLRTTARILLDLQSRRIHSPPSKSIGNLWKILNVC